MTQRQPPRKKQGKRPGLGESAANASTAVRQAVSVLENELSSGLADVRKIERRFTKEHRIDQKEFDAVLKRFQTNAHELIDVAAARVADLSSPDVQDLSQRLTHDAHQLFDVVIGMVGMAPEIMNRLTAKAEKAAPKPAAEPKPRARSAGQRPRPRA
jgi:hypothetical protein